MKKLGMLGIIGGAAILTAVPLSLQWSQKNVVLSHDSAKAETATSAAGVGRRAHRKAYRRAAYGTAVAGSGGYGYSPPTYSSYWIPYGTSYAAPYGQQLRHSSRAPKIRLRRPVRTDFLLRVPAALVLVICAAPGVRCRWPSRPVACPWRVGALGYPLLGPLTQQLTKDQFPVLLEYAEASFERIKQRLRHL